MLFQTQAAFTRKISCGIRAIISLLPANPPVIIPDNLEHYRQALSKEPNICLVCFVAVLSCLVCNCCWLTVCIVVVVLCVLLSYVYLLYYMGNAVFFTLDDGLLARSQYSEGPATGHLDTGFSWFPCA